MNDSWILMGTLGAVVVLGPWIAYTIIVQGNAWRTALLAIAQENGLKYVAPEGAASKKFDLVYGEDRGIDVKLCTEWVKRGENDALYSKIEASISPSSLVIVPPGSYKTDVVDFGAADGDAVTPTGIADFDRSVEIRGAKRPVLERFKKDPILRAEVMGLVNRGMKVRDGDVAVVAQFPKKAAITVARYKEVVSLARTLKELEA